MFQTVLCFVHSCVVATSTGAKQCSLVSGKPGGCVPLYNCNLLLELIKNLQKPLPKDVGILIKDSFFCGLEKGKIGVCCPAADVKDIPQITQEKEQTDVAQCTYQEGSLGSCVEYTKCFPFIQLLQNLRKPLPPAVPQIMREVYLCGRDGGTGIPKICCPNDGIVDQKHSGALKKPPTTTTTTTTTSTTTTTVATSQTTPSVSSTSTATTTASTTITSTSSSFNDHPGMDLLSSLDTCGRSLVLSRIVGGMNASLGQYPWLANIGYSVTGSAEVEYKCGGSLIGRRHILTAAHCLAGLPSNYKFTNIRLGEHDISNDIPDCDKQQNFCAPLPQDFTPEVVTIHPEYNKPNRFNNDIAIVKLDRDVMESDFVSPICLPFPSEFGSVDIQNPPMPPVVAGWGATDVYARIQSDVPMYVPVPMFEFDSCADIYKMQRVTLLDTQLCAGGEKGKDSCAGDSGSSLMLEVEVNSRPYDPRWIQVGVVSFGPRRCATKGMPAVYTNVTAYLPWILSSVLLQ